MTTKSLDLGCGSNPRNPFGADEVFGVDLDGNPEKGIKKADLAIERIPFDNEVFDYVTAYDFIEHVPRTIYLPERRNPFVELMSDAYRVLKMGGTFLSLTPAYPYAPAFQDPTHVNIITTDTFGLYLHPRNGAGLTF
jgi:SAM-dependent methyltransferase